MMCLYNYDIFPNKTDDMLANKQATKQHQDFPWKAFILS